MQKLSLFYYFPSDYRTHPDTPSLSPNQSTKGLRVEAGFEYPECPQSSDSEMQLLFSAINEVLRTVKEEGVILGREKLLGNRVLLARKNFMSHEFVTKGGHENMSPLTATVKIPTKYLLDYLAQYESSSYKIGELLRNRKETIVYKVNSKFRGDPYPGALSAVDYLVCREGKTFEERRYNLVFVWGEMTVEDEKLTIESPRSSITDFVEAVQTSENKNLLSKGYKELKKSEIPRYYMQVRYGSTFSKVKHVRVYSYFADAILFQDGALWRDA